jgi:hypothetical protein
MLNCIFKINKHVARANNGTPINIKCEGVTKIKIMNLYLQSYTRLRRGVLKKTIATKNNVKGTLAEGRQK